jgi:hypothetical protein
LITLLKQEIHNPTKKDRPREIDAEIGEVGTGGRERIKRGKRNRASQEPQSMKLDTKGAEFEE